MFSGIVEELGVVDRAEPGSLELTASKVMDDLKSGDSICVNGVCLTVTSRGETSFSVDVVPETLRRSNLGSLSEGDPVNLERGVEGRRALRWTHSAGPRRWDRDD